ncbi:MAG: hypothetical protein LQ351_007669, partial [Letrouitia transgressa]
HQGGGIVGSATAYFLTHHDQYNPEVHSVTILEASSIAGGSSGKAGGLLGSWATPSCLAPLSFKTHAQLAQKHGGDKVWGHRFVYCADVKLQAQNLESLDSQYTRSPSIPSALDWLLPGAVGSYKEIGNPSNTAQVNPYMFTTTLAKLSEERGAKTVYGSATKLNFESNDRTIVSVTYTHNGTTSDLLATDLVIAAGPWTSKIFPSIQLGAPRGHSVIVRPSRALSPYVLSPKIEPPVDGSISHILSPEICPRPADGLYDYDTVYASEPDDYSVPLPNSTVDVAVDLQKCEDVYTALKSVSDEIHKGEVLVRQACYKPQVRPHREDEEVGPIVGPAPGLDNVWIATGHDEWGIQNSAGTGLVVSEMVWEGEAKSANCESLDPKHFVKAEGAGEKTGFRRFWAFGATTSS